MALPSLVLVLGVALAAVGAGSTHLACVDAARVGARALARGDPPSAVRVLAEEVAPDHAEVELSEDPGFARATVTAPVRVVPGIAVPVEVGATAATPSEARS